MLSFNRNISNLKDQFKDLEKRVVENNVRMIELLSRLDGRINSIDGSLKEKIEEKQKVPKELAVSCSKFVIDK